MLRADPQAYKGFIKKQNTYSKGDYQKPVHVVDQASYFFNFVKFFFPKQGPDAWNYSVDHRIYQPLYSIGCKHSNGVLGHIQGTHKKSQQHLITVEQQDFRSRKGHKPAA